ncbi:hypothetical protein QFC19_003524 [Naganishia cerealis]|uniref:Uncharacterized protein n=1 Tax=Naganishia cerealis TaxID=610337 RepID=A0ACC2W4H9_9TREE|nr:hypothetical protein QFC19_003524 [Naganishia cerealis]
MDAPEEELTSLVPSSVFARNRKNSRHGYMEEQVVPGPLRLAGPSTSPIHSGRLPSGYIDGKKRSSSTNEELEESRRKGVAAAREKRVHGDVNGKGKQPVYETEVEYISGIDIEGKGEESLVKRRNSAILIVAQAEESDDEGQDLCVICLQAVRDATIVGECGHKIFCFECINVWANQSRKCPLCTRPMAPFLLHELDSPVGPTKFYLPPLPSIRPNPVSTQASFASSSALHRHRVHRAFHHRNSGLVYSHRDGLRGRGEDLWARVKREKQGMREEDVLERAIARRREIYRHGLYAKHIASNTFTRFKPSPTPCQFAADKETIARATSFIRRELRVWPHLDVEFLTTYIVSLMKSIDIRSEPAVRLLADFLDERGSQGRDRRGAEHFAHEVYSFLRSPYRDLALYDAIAQYDKPAWEPEYSANSDSDSDAALAGIRAVDAPPGDVIDVDAPSPRRGPSSPARARQRSSSPSVHSVVSDAESVRPVSPNAKRRKRTRRSDKRWDESDSYIAPGSPSIPIRKQWNRSDSWVNPESPYLESKKPVVSKASDSGVLPDDMQNVVPVRPAVIHRGMRGWGESVEWGTDVALRGSVPSPRTLHASSAPGNPTTQADQTKPSLELRIFGIAARTASEQTEGVASAAATKNSHDTDDEDRAPTNVIWAPEIANLSVQSDDIRSMLTGSTAQPSTDKAVAPESVAEENFMAKLTKEKMKQLPDVAGHSSETVGLADSVGAPESERGQAADVVEVEAKARARLALKLRLEKEKAIAQARMERTQAARVSNDASDRAVTLRAKLLEKKLANSRVAKQQKIS